MLASSGRSSARTPCAPVPASVNPAGEDRYRIWVNGVYVAGNWVDADATVPGAFTLAPPAASPALFMHKGVRYPVRWACHQTLEEDGSLRLRRTSGLG